MDYPKEHSKNDLNFLFCTGTCCGLDLLLSGLFWKESKDDGVKEPSSWLKARNWRILSIPPERKIRLQYLIPQQGERRELENKLQQ
jgi:hypothetical protein